MKRQEGNEVTSTRLSAVIAWNRLEVPAAGQRNQPPPAPRAARNRVPVHKADLPLQGRRKDPEAAPVSGERRKRVAHAVVREGGQGGHSVIRPPELPGKSSGC